MTNKKDNYSNDKIKGMLIGVVLGDISGSMHEFKRQTKQKFQKKIYKYKTSTVNFRFHKLTIEPRIPTDDSEMTLALFKSLKKSKFTYDKNLVLSEYMNWANKSKSIGVNTRKLLKGIKTISGYSNRFNKLTKDEKKVMQSNGSLMRASPLALVDIKNSLIDCALTNPNKINCELNFIYVKCLKKLLRGKSKSSIKKYLKKYKAKSSKIKQIIKDIFSKDNLSDKYQNIGKGWVGTAFYLAFKAFFKYEKFTKAMKWLVVKNPGSDTDTNCAISGALFGALLGFSGLNKSSTTKKNIKFLFKANKNNNRLDIDLIKNV